MKLAHSTFLGVVLLLLVAAPAGAQRGPGSRFIQSSPGIDSRPSALSFVENRGQWDTPARFVAHRGPMVARVEKDALVVQLRDGSRGDAGQILVARIVFDGACDDVEIVGETPLPGVRNYCLGDDPDAWRTAVPAYTSVLYRGLYPGIDLRVRDDSGRLEYDLLLAPGADPRQVTLRCEGVDGLEIAEDGALSMRTELGPIRQTPPRTWRVLPGGERQPIDCRFVLLDQESYGFRLPEHDSSLPVVIDPGLEWSTFLGGSGEETLFGMARRSNGEIVVVGYTYSADFPTTAGVHDDQLGGVVDASVTVLDPSGSTLVWSTFLGGSGFDYAMDVEVNAAGNVFVTGISTSTDFPTTADGYSTGQSGGFWDGFIAELAADGSALAYGTYLGGVSNDWPTNLELREPRVLTVGGIAGSFDFPTTPNAVQPVKAGGRDYFVSRLDLDQPPGSQLRYSTFLGGSSHDGVAASTANPFDVQVCDVHLDASDVVTVTGLTFSSDFPTTANAFEATHTGTWEAFLTRIDPSQSGAAGLLYSTFIGGAAAEEGGVAIAVDGAGVVTLGGYTYSSDFPSTPGSFDPTFHGPTNYNDAFVLRLDPSLPPQSQLLYSTFLAGDGWEATLDLTLGADGKIVVSGFTGDNVLVTNSFPTTCGAYSETFGGLRDGFLVYLDPAGNGQSDLLYSTLVGGALNDGLNQKGLGIVPTSAGLQVVLSAWTQSADFPTTTGAYQQTYAGGWDGAVLQLEINPHTYCVAAPNSASPDGARICGTGSVEVADNAFTLSVSDVPAGEFGYFLTSRDQGLFMPPASQGFLCLAGDIGRYNGAVGQGPSFSVPIDLTSMPVNPPIPALPGDTWYFQCWYRDGNTSNFSNGLAVTFH